MIKQFQMSISLLLSIFALVVTSHAYAEDSVTQPSVSRRMIICDTWQWIGGTATTWGCLSTPREAHVASGETADQVIHSLQQQINDLQARLKKLEHPQHEEKILSTK